MYTYPALDRHAYLNTSGIGLIPEEHIQASRDFNDDLLLNGSLAFEKWRAEDYPRIRTKASEFIGCKESELAFLPNFSFGLIAILPIIQVHKKVLLYRDDYPSLRDPFVLGDYEVSWVESPDGFFIDTEEIKGKLLKEDIQLFVISHVQYLSGFCIAVDELGAFCQENGITFVVDTTQSLGRTELNFERSGIDILISSNYKWMNSGFGSGVLCIRQKFLEENPAKVAGYGSYTMENGDFFYEPSILSYEGGHLNCSGLNMLDASLSLKKEIGAQKIIQKGDDLLEYLILQLASIDYPILGDNSLENRAGIVCIPGNSDQFEELRKANIQVTFRNGHFRIGPHFYNKLKDIDTLINSLRKKTN